MEMRSGSCRFGLRFVHVEWTGDTVHRVRFATTGIPGEVPEPVRLFCAGRQATLGTLRSRVLDEDTVYARIYRVVQQIPYGQTATYGEVAEMAGTHPRVVGQAMARNPTPLIIPCHRVVAADGIGGFSPDIAIKEELLAMEKKGVRKFLRVNEASPEQQEDLSGRSHPQIPRPGPCAGSRVRPRRPHGGGKGQP
jgi:methylated-DNA-[protein]-cysteine S-methyltransferase